MARLALQVRPRPRRTPEHQRPELREPGGLRRHPAGRAEVALRLPLPEQGRGDDPGPDAPGPDRARSAAGRSSWWSRPRRRAVFRPREGATLRGDRRARWSPRRWPTRCRTRSSCCSWRRVLVMAATLTLRLPHAAAAAPARARAGRRGRMTFGALSLAGGSLTMASIAVLPVLIGLAVDYAIQFQARFDEQRARRRGGGGRPRGRARGRRRGRDGGRPHDRDRRRRHRGGLPRAAAVAGADGARLRPAARDRHRSWRSCWRSCAGFAALVRFGGGRRAARSGRLRARLPRSERIRAARRARAAGRTAPGARSASRSRARAGCSRSGSRWRCWAWRSTPRARWCRTSSSSCRRTSRRCAT